MSIHLHREMEQLNRAALEMCAHVEQNVRDAAKAFLERDVDLALRVVETDRFVDRMEADLEENCLKTLALYQPVARDLRFIFSLSKISGILERIGDLAENLAKKGKSLSQQEPVAMPPEIIEMADQARIMLKDSIDSLVDGDTMKARGIIAADEAINAKKRLVKKAAVKAIEENPKLSGQWLTIVAASRNIERMADMAVNIAAEVVYSIDGKMIRHGFDAE